MKQFVLSDESDSSGLFRITGGDFHYLARVRRIAINDVINAVLPTGEPVLFRITDITSNAVLGKAEKNECAPHEVCGQNGTPEIILFQAMPKGAKLDLIVRQAAELALSEVAPFYAEHSVPREKNSDARLGRLARIVKEARQQSGSPVQTVVRTPVDFYGICAYWNGINAKYKKTIGIILHETSLEKDTFHGYLDKEVDAAVLAIGPEGGFSQREAEAFIAIGFKPIRLGNTILRTETAALYAAAVVRTLILERASWMNNFMNV